MRQHFHVGYISSLNFFLALWFNQSKKHFFFKCHLSFVSWGRENDVFAGCCNCVKSENAFVEENEICPKVYEALAYHDLQVKEHWTVVKCWNAICFSPIVIWPLQLLRNITVAKTPHFTNTELFTAFNCNSLCDVFFTCNIPGIFSGTSEWYLCSYFFKYLCVLRAPRSRGP